MSQYEDRLAVVEHALAAENIKPAKGKTLADLAAKVLHAIDHIQEHVR